MKWFALCLIAASLSGCFQPDSHGNDAQTTVTVTTTASPTGPPEPTTTAPPPSNTTPPQTPPTQSNSTDSWNDTSAEANGTADQWPTQFASLREWGSPDGKILRPAIESSAAGGGCTTNFLFHENDARFFFGSAAHCIGEGGLFIPSECSAIPDSLANGDPVELHGRDGERYPATLAYSSWNAMLDANETNDATCQGNDFALYEISSDLVNDTHPAVIHLSGPSKLPAGFSMPAEDASVHATGNSDTHYGGLLEACPRKISGTIGSYDNQNWTIRVDGAILGSIQGDSGSGLMDNNGTPVGVLSTGNTATGDSGWTNIWKALSYMEEHEGWAPSIVTWPGFDPDNEDDDPCNP